MQLERSFPPTGVTPATRSRYRYLVRRQVNQAIPDRHLGKDLRGLNESDLMAAAERLYRYGSEYASATRRLYKASLAWSLQECRKTRGEEWGREVESRLKSLDLRGPIREADALRRVPKNFENWLREQDGLTGLQLGVQKFFLANIHVGLRPVEWFGSKMFCPWPPTDGYNAVLHIRSAKTTHGRGRGYWREISLAGMPPSHLNDVIWFLKYLNRWIDASPRWRKVDFEQCDVQTRAAASWSFYHPLREEWWEMRRKLLEAGVLAPDEECLTFYSTRHQAVASAKRELDPEDVARVFGHAVPETARVWYGWRRDGRNGFGVRPYADAKGMTRSLELQSEIVLAEEQLPAPEEATRRREPAAVLPEAPARRHEKDGARRSPEM